MLTEPLGAVVSVGVGVGVGEGVAKVVINRHVKSDDIALPAISFTPVVIFAVYVVEYDNSLNGVNCAVVTL